MSFPLNPEQLEAVRFRQGYVAVNSGPGSGKTRVITERVHELLKEGYAPEIILALTFTREASAEMAERSGLPDDQKIFRTFHSFCLELVHREARFLPFQLIQAPPEAGQQRKLLYSICRDQHVEFKKLVGFISGCKRKMIEPEQAMNAAKGAAQLRLAAGYQTYETRCREEGWIDFDSMLTETVKLLEIPEVRARWQYKFVLVDEAQDTDTCQWKIVSAISEEFKNVFAVGDEEQLIYEWRGAEPDGLSKFATRFPGCRIIYLFRNYRSTPEIVEFCKQFAPKKSELIDRMVSERASGDGSPIVRRFATESDEATKTIGSILDPEHSAILARTNRQLSKFENACIDRGIKYNLLGKSGFWTQPEVKYLLAYTQAVHFPTDAAVKTIIQSPYRHTKYLRKLDVVKAIEGYAKREKDATGRWTPYMKLMTNPQIQSALGVNQAENLQKAHTFIRSLSTYGIVKPEQAIMQTCADADVWSYYETEEEGDGDNDAKGNINELSKIAARFNDIPSFLDYARRAIAASRRSRSPRLTLSTIHQAKGKEWKHVYVVGVSQDVLPHKRGVLAEERRIMWVALTRAADNLVVSFSGQISPFLEKHWSQESQAAIDAQPQPGFNGQSNLFEGLMS